MIESQKFYQDLEAGKAQSVYLIVGEEPFLLKQAFNFLKGTLLQAHELDFNFQIFHGTDLKSDANIESLKDALQTLPMMSARRLVILKEADEIKDSVWEEISTFSSNPVESTVFAIFANRVDKRKKSIKNIYESATILEFKKPFENQIPTWIRYIAETYQIEIEDEAVHELHRRVGSHLLEIESALLRLKDYLGEVRRIILADVEKVLSQTRDESVFDFVAALGHANRVKALEILVNVLDQGQSEVGMISLLARHFRLLYQLKKHQAQGLNGAKLAQAMHIPSYFLNQYLDQGRVWTESQIQKVFIILSETDLALKSSPISASIWLENLILKISGLTGASKQRLDL